MWDRLRKQLMVEREQLNQLIATHRPLLDKCAVETPSDIELSALAAMLHSFYTGIENMLKRVAIEIDGSLPTGDSWHRELLDAMRQSNDTRPAAISQPVHERLKEYLQFRHFFRQAYSFQLQWEKMATLTLNCESTLRMLEQDLNEFLRSGD